MNIRWVGSYVHHVVEKQKLPSFFIDGFDKFEQKKRWKRYGGRNKIPFLQLAISQKACILFSS